MKILLVEDEPRVLRSLAQALREESWAVNTADNGPDGLFMAEAHSHDVIVLDVMLPGMDGWQVLERLRKSKATPVLMLTARDAGGDKVRGLDLGADDYLIKPFDLPELFARLRALVRRSLGQTQSSIEFADLAIDMRSKTVVKASAPILLTPREYSILEYLALRRGKVVSRTEIYEHLFEDSEDTLSNLVDVHVVSIRKKLGRDLIATRRGQGYVIE